MQLLSVDDASSGSRRFPFGVSALVIIVALSLQSRRQPNLVRAVKSDLSKATPPIAAITSAAPRPAISTTIASGKNFSALAESLRTSTGLRLVAKTRAFSVKTYHGPIRGGTVDASELDRYSLVLRRELRLYPIPLVRRSALKAIVLCGDLSFDGQNRSAIPDFEHDTLYLDAQAGRGKASYERKALHHEVFHVIDYRDDGELYSDHRWAKLNPARFRYGEGGARMQDDRLSSLPSTAYGFLTKYATSGVEEDKAEVFAHLMTNHAAVEQRAANDDIITRKVAFMKTLLEEFCPAMSDTYWQNLGRED